MSTQRSGSPIGKLAVGLAKPLVKGDVLAFEAVDRAVATPRMGTRKPGLGRRVENDGEVGLVGPDGDLFQPLDQPRIDMAEHTLIDACRIRQSDRTSPSGRDPARV